MPPIPERDRVAQLLFYAAVILIGYLVFQIVQPFLVPLGWAGVLAVSLQPLFRRVASRIGRSWAAGLCVALVFVLLILPVWLLVQSLVSEGAQAVAGLQNVASSAPPRQLSCCACAPTNAVDGHCSTGVRRASRIAAG